MVSAIVSATVRDIGTHACSPAFSAVPMESYRKSVIVSAIFHFAANFITSILNPL